ncbi:hypothetical protein BDQ17DRAFT_1235463 [Cyathus striatus]|nr:hypothetical protein BDQ17DRAFT_1235463 [Cyathus striatus]
MSVPLELADIVVRPLTSADLSNVRELHSRILPIRYPASFFLQLLVLSARSCLVAYCLSDPNTPIGFISTAIQQPLADYNRLSLIPSSHRNTAAPPSTTKLQPILDARRPRIEILTLGVLPPYRHRGLARHLIRCAVHKFTPSSPLESGRTVVYANVSTANASALKFYDSLGMHVAPGVITNLYRTPAYGSRDAYLVLGLLSAMDDVYS